MAGIPAWPSTLPQRFLRDGYEEQEEDFADRSSIKGPVTVQKVWSRAAARTFVGNFYVRSDQIDILESISRVMNKIVTNEQRTIAMKARELLATYREVQLDESLRPNQ